MQNTYEHLQLNHQKTDPPPIKNWAKDLTRHFTKEDTLMAINIRKDAQYHTSLGNRKLKQQ